MNLFDGDNSSIEDESQIYDDPNFNLNVQQKDLVEWMVTKERQEPYGGIIATDMGSIGCRMAIIMSLLLKSSDFSAINTQSEGETDLDESNIKAGHTLIVCSKMKMNEWIEWVQKNMPHNVLNVCLHYGRYREKSLQKLSENHIVVTTTTLVTQSFIHPINNVLHRIKWGRIILDDALCVSNHKRVTFKALCQLTGTYRWAFLGTKSIDDNDKNTYYSLIKYINYKPYNNLKKWNNWMKMNPTVAVKDKLQEIFYNKRVI